MYKKKVVSHPCREEGICRIVLEQISNIHVHQFDIHVLMHSRCDARYILVMYRLLRAGMVLTCELFLVEINSTLFWLSISIQYHVYAFDYIVCNTK